MNPNQKIAVVEPNHSAVLAAEDSGPGGLIVILYQNRVYLQVHKQTTNQ